MGWAVHVLGDHFPDDGEHTSDPEWVLYGLQRGWCLLTQDLRIAVQPAAMQILDTHRGLIYCLDNANLSIRLRAERFKRCQRVIHQHVLDRKAGFYVVGDSGPPRRKR